MDPKLYAQPNKISVVVPVYNGQDTIEALLESLRAQDVQPCEVIVVDNNSTDSTQSIIEKWCNKNESYPLKLLHENRQGRTFARNKGIATASGDYIAFFDADCIVARDWIACAQQIIKKNNFIVIGGVVQGHHPKNAVEKTLHFLHCPRQMDGIEFKSINQWNIMRGDLETNNVLIEKKALLSVNCFEENAFFVTGEDFDLFLRIYKKGGLIKGLHKKLLVYHQHRSSLKSMAKQVFGYGYSFAECVAAHFKHQIVFIGKKRHFASAFPITVWVRLSRAFIALGVLLLATMILPIGWVLVAITFFLIPFVFLWYFRLTKEYRTTSFFELFKVLCVAFLHKLLLLSGHIWGSILFRVICI